MEDRSVFARRALAIWAVFVMLFAGIAITSQPASAASTVTPTSIAHANAIKGNPVHRPAAGSATRSGARLLGGPYYFYGVAEQWKANTGVAANLVTIKPYVNPADDHSLVEIAVHKTTAGHTLELGVTVDPSTCAVAPCLFGYWWNAGVGQCYNATCPGWVDNAANPINLGATLPYPLSKRFTIEYISGNWWASYDNAWLGYWSPNLFTGGFTSSDFVQGFGEIAAGTLTPCTDMGYNGELGTALNLNAARVGTWSVKDAATGVWGSGTQNVFVAGPTGTTIPSTVLQANAAGSPPDPRTMRYGGPMWNAAGTGPGIANGC